MEKNNRKPELAVFNVVLCLLVIFIHVSSTTVTALQKDSWQYAAVFFPWRLSAFVVPGFIFLSGIKLFLNRGDKFDLKRFYSGRFLKVVVPYLAWNMVYYLYFIARGYFGFSVADFLKYLATGTLVSPFYFIIIIVQFYALAPLWALMVKKAAPVLAIALSIPVTIIMAQFLPQMLTLINPDAGFIYNDRIFTTYLCYWIAGCYVGANYQNVKAALKSGRAFISAVFAVATITEAVLSYISLSGIAFILWLENVHFLYCICAVLFLFTLLCSVYEKRRLTSALILGIDRASYKIFLSHCLVIFIVNEAMSRLGIHREMLMYPIRFVVVYAVTISLCILLDVKRLSKLWGKK